MCDYDHGHAGFGQLAHDIQHLADHLRIQRRGGLVEEHHFRIHHERADDSDALLLAAGELVGEAGSFVFQADAPQERHASLFGFLRCHLFQLHWGGSQVFDDVHVVEEIELLENHAHLFPVTVDVDVLVADIDAVHVDAAGGRDFHEIEAAEEGALAAARRTDDGNHFVLAEGSGDVVQHSELVEPLGEVLNTDDDALILWIKAFCHAPFSFLSRRSPC